MKIVLQFQKSQSIILQTGSPIMRRLLISVIVVIMMMVYSLTGTQSVQAQTYGPPLFTETFGAVPEGQNANTYRGEITGRGTIGNIYWFWPRTCTGSGWITLIPPTLEVSFANTLPPGEQGVTEWSFVETTGTGTWYDVCGIMKQGHWERYRLRQSVACASWSSTMDDGGYALSTNPRYVHSPNGGDGSDIAWHDGPDHTSGDVNGMMLVVNAALEKGLFYKRTITGLCYGAQFEYKSYYANVLKTTACGGEGIDINIRYEIWSKNPGDDESNALITVGNSACNGAILLAQTNTGNVGESSTLTWYSTSLIFNVPQNQDSIFIILRNNGPGGCGNDLAIDDITFRPYIPFTLGYERVPTDYCTTGLIRLQATLLSGSIPANYVFQWQVADLGNSNWASIGSPTNFENAYIDLDIGAIGNKIYRTISAASIENLNNLNCYVASSSFDGNSVVLPTGSLTVTADVCGTAEHTPVNATFTVNYQGNIFPWTYYYKINAGDEQFQIVNSPDISNTKTISITDNTIITLVKISTSDCDILINSDKLITYSIGPPGPPIQITGPNPACIGDEADFSVSEVQGAISYTWVVSGDWQLISGQGTRFVRLRIGSTPISVEVTTVNSCGTNVYNSPIFQTTNLPPGAPADIATPNGICFPYSSVPGSTDVLFEASEISGAYNYIWDWDSPVVLGNQQSGTGQYLQRIILSVPNYVTSFTVRVKSQNGCGFSIVKEKTFIPDNIPPAIACPESIMVQCISPAKYIDLAAFIAAGGSVSDTNSGINSASFSWVSDVSDNNTCPETITRTYLIDNNCGNGQTCEQIIIIDDTIAPVITPPSPDLQVECNDEGAPEAIYNWLATASASDNCDNSVTVTNNYTTIAMTCNNEITVSFYATDLCGNVAGTKTAKIKVIDNVNPSLECPNGILAVCGATEPYIDYAAFIADEGSASDNCGLNEASFEWVSDVSDGNTNPETITRTYRIEDNCGNEATCQQIITVQDIGVVTWVYLEGAAISIGGTQTYTLPMRISLNNVNNVKVLPGQTYYSSFSGDVYSPAGQPYNIAPWNYAGAEGSGYDSYGNSNPGTANYPATVVDWVLVSLRETAEALPVCMKAGLLHNDGHVEFVDGGFNCCDIDFAKSYYLVIEHRNHLIIMSQDPIQIINGTITYDFRYTQSYGSGQKQIIPGTFAMFAGNGDQTQESFSPTDINFDDATYWGSQNGTSGRYRNGDYNLNGDCNYNDRTTFEFNNGMFSIVGR
jgi:hypothetical protein